MTMKLVLLRHGQSEYNKENKFCGWHDAELSDQGRKEAADAGRALKEAGFDFDVCYTSYLKRAIHTLDLALTSLDRCWLPVYKTWRLNERHYGALQGLNKSDTAAKYGEDQVKIWRRSFATTPPLLKEDDPRNPALQEQYRGIPKEDLPLGESLKLTIDRVMPYYNETILPQMLAGKRVLIAAHGNSLRALAMSLEGMSEEEILGFNIPTGVPLVYTLDDEGKFISKEYIGDPDVIAAKITAVANQGKAK
ncbi:MAG: 2,3-diphosphoglycerate-dependent phosphoglycerate mutase [Pseudoramibacter sp.]|nr:2,3-diphosphoglycerate-dependent phosphoglycerate mutase [Pseudoramibacter sp.]MCH4072241.1 2,3-diphosphoglycerate-dependent phosphoglycerate mutase [Pseudoramibacter sp.]